MVRPRKTRLGIGVDAHGGPTIDPTENVIALVKAEKERQDGLRELNNKYIEAELRAGKEVAGLRHTCAEEVAALRDIHLKEIRAMESDRLEKMRQVDVLAGNTSADRALVAIQTLATSQAAERETLRNLVSTTAATIATQTAAANAQLIERIASLEKASYTGMGKQAVVDPQMERLSAIVEQMARSQASGLGKSEGISASWVVLLGVVSLIFGLLGIAGVLYAALT